MMKILWILILVSILSACINHPPTADKIFTNAQIQYQSKEPNTLIRKRDMAMSSYFYNTEYQENQISLSKIQEKKIDAIFKKLVYPEEYKLYVSFGADRNDKVANLAPILKRAEYIKKKYTGQLKTIEVAYIKNQKPNSAYFRLIT